MEDPRWKEIFDRLEALEQALKDKQEAPSKPAAKKG